ncbi:endolytic transglycosylase MltG [Brevibacillus sp. SYP-B805]|uniref:endolytic transglycosylase MltG n=1 Tax=Brevibacillus sp. SYP-B805 TaxID=1578199 RepID=UPI001F498D0D|nr:endolytic transglycosylase MltG [Brevibacillus sp. SYP-B805]
MVLVLAAGSGVYYVYAQLQPVAPGSQAVQKQVKIPPGASVREIGGLLEENGLIRSGTIFAYYVRSKGVGSRLQAGTYSFRVGQTIDEMVASMVNGDVIPDSVRFTIPEGWNVEQIATALAEQKLVDKEKFLKEVNTGSFPEFPFVAAIPKKAERKYRLEGYLFPDTYEVKKGATEHEIIAKMLAQFQKEMKPEWVETLKKRQMSIDDAVNLASIVEREVVVDKERPIVAGVFFNRIREHWLLQSCATVQFVLGKQRDRITFDDLKVDSPYNTYLHPGLPPGPIANPGRASLAAVVQPAKHDYFFFVTKKDGSSEHYFSKTYEEHLAKDAKSRGSW